MPVFLLSRRGSAGTGLLVIALLTAIPAPAKEVFTAIRATTAGAPGAAMARVSITIESYTTGDEARELLQAAASGGKEAVAGVLRNLNKGSATVAGGQRLRINAARVYPKGTGRRIVIICDRPVAPAPRSQTLEYPFGVIELEVDSKGAGDGQLVEAATVRLDDRGFVEVERYLISSQLLVEVQMEQTIETKR